MITLKDISKKVGKSITTVSRALNDYDDVNPETKKMIQEIAKEMGYRPNIIAQRLQKQKADTIGFIVPTFGPRFSDPFFSEFLAGVGNMASDLGFDLLVSTQPPGEKESIAYQKMMDGQRIDGFIIVRTRRNDVRINNLLKQDFPFTVFGRIEGRNDFPYVDEDGVYGMRQIADHLVSLGHTRIGCIAPAPELMFTEIRLEGLKSGLASHNIHLNGSMHKVGDLTQRGGYLQAKAILNEPNPPTAIVACNDLMAFGAISAAQDLGLKVGKDITITGFDDIPLAEYSHPSLTTVHQPIYKIGGMVCEMLIKTIRGHELKQKHILLKPSLIIRESSGKNYQ
jgi:LacI family transcriptional regulator